MQATVLGDTPGRLYAVEAVKEPMDLRRLECHRSAWPPERLPHLEAHGADKEVEGLRQRPRAGRRVVAQKHAQVPGLQLGKVGAEMVAPEVLLGPGREAQLVVDGDGEE